MTPRCATCRFMGGERSVTVRATDDEDDYSYEDVPFRVCTAMRAVTGETTATDLCPRIATLVERERFGASMLVRPDFGCVMHEEKDT